MPVDAKLLHCDLCILAYQNYHQAVIWPLDPWYEVLARGGTDRRTLFMKAVHALASPAKLTSRTLQRDDGVEVLLALPDAGLPAGTLRMAWVDAFR